MRRRPHPRATDATAELARIPDVVRKYLSLCREHAVVDDDSGGASSAALLAVAAMRAGATALAAVRDGRCVVRNDRWVALAEERGAAWRRVGTEAAAPEEYATLEALALAGAAELAASGATALATRCERGDGELVVDVRLERAGVEAPPVVLAMICDVTERVRSERDLSRMREVVESQERLQAIGELASGVAHDLNNTLHALRLRLSRLAGCVSGCRDHEEDLRVIERIASDAAARVRRLQDLSRRREDVPDERVELAAVVADAIAIVRPQTKRAEEAARVEEEAARVEIDVALPHLAPVVGNRGELGHVLVNLLLNATDAMPRGGRIAVTGRTSGDGQVEVTVADEGRGIPAGHLERIFEPFFTTKGRGGAGLGLCVAAGVMRRLGGSIRAENRPGGGASFTLRFPSSGAARSTLRPRVPAATTLEARRVLVVDDDPDNLEAMRLVLAHDGHAVAVTESGVDAMQRVEAGERYDTIFCDLGLGDATGWEVASRIGALAPGTRVLLVTGWADEIAPDDPRRRDVAGVLSKPLGAEELRDLVRGAPTIVRDGEEAPASATPPTERPRHDAAESVPPP